MSIEDLSDSELSESIYESYLHLEKTRGGKKTNDLKKK